MVIKNLLDTIYYASTALLVGIITILKKRKQAVKGEVIYPRTQG